jgi:hypothetical protein
MKGAEEESAAAAESANFNAAQARRQAEISGMREKDALDRGEADRLAYLRDFQQEQGSRAASMGASGIALDSGSSLDVLADSAAAAALDASTIRANAGKEAWGYREQAGQALTEAGLSEMAGQNAVTAGERKKTGLLLNTAGSLFGQMGGGSF